MWLVHRKAAIYIDHVVNNYICVSSHNQVAQLIEICSFLYTCMATYSQIICVDRLNDDSR